MHGLMRSLIVSIGLQRCDQIVLVLAPDLRYVIGRIGIHIEIDTVAAQADFRLLSAQFRIACLARSRTVATLLCSAIP